MDRRACSRRKSNARASPSLKVRFNSVFGYYIEVTKTNLEKVPADYIRKQTIANGERFFTPELKEMEHKILGAEERANALGVRNLPADPRRSGGDNRHSIQEPASAHRHAGRVGGFGGAGAAPELLPACVNDGDRIEIRRWPASGAGADAGRRAVCAERHVCSTTGEHRSSSSPARTWRARAPTSGRWRCWC